jgi:hypothetical protein
MGGGAMSVLFDTLVEVARQAQAEHEALKALNGILTERLEEEVTNRKLLMQAATDLLGDVMERYGLESYEEFECEYMMALARVVWLMSSEEWPEGGDDDGKGFSV